MAAVDGARVKEVVLGGPHESALEPLVEVLLRVREGVGGRKVVLVGGLAVAVRLTVPERATQDLDSAFDAPRRGPSTATLLLSSGQDGVAAGDRRDRVVIDDVVVDVIDVLPLDHYSLELAGADDALFAAAHRYAIDTAEPVRLTAGRASTEVLVATVPALVATKLHAANYRSQVNKKATDLFDLHRLLSQHDQGGRVATALAAAGDPLPRLLVETARAVFVERLDDGARLLRSHGDQIVAAVDEEDLAAVGEVFLAVLESEMHA